MNRSTPPTPAGRRAGSAVLAAAATLALAGSASAAVFADRVVSYDPGDARPDLRDATAALGAPSPVVGAGTAFAGRLSPFNPHFEPGEVVQIGVGGQLTLGLSAPVAVGPGKRIGVVENVGLGYDFANDRPNADANGTGFGADAGFVSVSADGQTFVGLDGAASPTLVSFDLPANAYQNVEGGPFGPPPADPVLADFGIPFDPAAGADAFDNLSSYADVLDVLGGSGGGTWLDVSATGLATVGFVRFSVPAGGAATSLEIDAVSVADFAVVPEPGAVGLVLAGAWGLGRRGRRRASGGGD